MPFGCSRFLHWQEEARKRKAREQVSNAFRLLPFSPPLLFYAQKIRKIFVSNAVPLHDILGEDYRDNRSILAGRSHDNCGGSSADDGRADVRRDGGAEDRCGRANGGPQNRKFSSRRSGGKRIRICGERRARLIDNSRTSKA